MFKFLAAALALLALTACAPTGPSPFPENRAAANCFTGYHAFDLEVTVPSEYGQVLALTQFSNDANGLRPVCVLAVSQSQIPGLGYPIFTGEIDAGRSGICVSARTTNAGHVLSCASASRVLRAVDAPLGTSTSLIRLTDWRPFP